jgi:hypothetical protein
MQRSLSMDTVRARTRGPSVAIGLIGPMSVSLGTWEAVDSCSMVGAHTGWFGSRALRGAKASLVRVSMNGDSGGSHRR